MLSLSLLTLGLAIIGAYAKPTIHAPGGLEVSLSTPADTVTSVSEIRVVAAVKNIGDEDLTIRKSGTVLDNQHPTRSFIVTKDGKGVSFTGFKVFFSTDYLSKDDLVVIPAGTTVTAEHDVSAVYEFSAAGPGTFTFDPVSKFQTIGVNNTIGASIARSVSITVINVSKREPNLEKRISIDCDDPEKSKVIRFGYLEAQIMAGLAVENINTYGSDDQLYKDCFGSNPLGVVIANFNDMAFDRGPDEFVSCRRCDGTGIFGPNHIEYCDLFFRLPTRNALCKKGSLKSHGTLGGATLLALSMSVLNAEARTLDCAKVPKFTNSEKLTNAASYSCYASQVYKYTQCR